MFSIGLKMQADAIHQANIARYGTMSQGHEPGKDYATISLGGIIQLRSTQQYYSTQEIAVLLRVNDATVRQWIAQGKLAGMTVGRVWSVSAANLKVFLEARASMDIEL